MTDKNKQGSGQEPKTGKRQGILDTYRCNQLSLRNFISRYMISPHDIEDVSQETFLRAYNAEQGKEIEQPKAFLFRIAKNLMLTEFSRKSKKLTDYIEDYEQPDVNNEECNLEADVMAQQRLGIYCEAVASLPSQCRRAVIMKKVYGMRNKEIARRMDISISTVEKHLTKGVRHCNDVMSKRYGSNTNASSEPTVKATVNAVATNRETSSPLNCGGKD